MNELIKSIFDGFTVDDVNIPVAFVTYEGHGEPYVVYSNETNDGSLGADDELVGYVTYYDFDVYSKGNYMNIIKKLTELLEQNDFRFQPSRSGADMYEADTGYFHKTINFAYLKEA